MAFTQDQYDAVLEAISNTDLPTNLKADMVQVMDKGNPSDLRQEFHDLPAGTVVQIDDVSGSTRIAVRNPSWAEESPMSLFYSGTPDDMRGRVIDGGHIGDLLWDNVVGMTVLAPTTEQKMVKEYQAPGGRTWIRLDTLDDVYNHFGEDVDDRYSVAYFNEDAEEGWEYWYGYVNCVDSSRLPVYALADRSSGANFFEVAAQALADEKKERA